jgi:hypothetical protein
MGAQVGFPATCEWGPVLKLESYWREQQKRKKRKKKEKKVAGPSFSSPSPGYHDRDVGQRACRPFRPVQTSRRGASGPPSKESKDPMSNYSRRYPFLVPYRASAFLYSSPSTERSPASTSSPNLTRRMPCHMRYVKGKEPSQFPG